MVLGKYVKCENLEDVNSLKRYIKQHRLYRYGPVSNSPYNSPYNLPFYYKVCKNSSWAAWQDIGDGGNWWSEKDFEEYKKALPIDVLYHPESYPEYFI